MGKRCRVGEGGGMREGEAGRGEGGRGVRERGMEGRVG